MHVKRRAHLAWHTLLLKDFLSIWAGSKKYEGTDWMSELSSLRGHRPGHLHSEALRQEVGHDQAEDTKAGGPWWRHLDTGGHGDSCGVCCSSGRLERRRSKSWWLWELCQRIMRILACSPNLLPCRCNERAACDGGEGGDAWLFPAPV